MTLAHITPTSYHAHSFFLNAPPSGSTSMKKNVKQAKITPETTHKE
jgi:hypothetical protein